MSTSAAGAGPAPRTRSGLQRALGGETNVNQIERAASVTAGAALAAYALKRKDLPGLLLGLVGGLLVERGVTGHCAVYGALGMNTAEDDQPVKQHGAAAVLDASTAQRVERSVTIYDKAPAELYAYWRRLENLPRIMAHLERVEEIDAMRSRWTAKAPFGRQVSWEAEVYNEVPDTLIAWRSLPGADVPNAGSVHFRPAPGGRGTEIRVILEYQPPAGRLGAAAARLFLEEPDKQVREDLRRFKSLVETGELPVSENPGQGGPAKEQFDAQVGQDPQVRAAAPAPEQPHEPRHIPQVADIQRGANTTEAGEAKL